MESAGTRRGLQSKEWAQPQAEASLLLRTISMSRLLLVPFPLLMYFIHNLPPTPHLVPFPCTSNAVVEVVLGLILFNGVVPLGSQK